MAPCEPGESVCVCICVCACMRVQVQLCERERESVCVDGMQVRAIPDETIQGVAPCELGTDKQKGMAIEVDGK